MPGRLVKIVSTKPVSKKATIITVHELSVTIDPEMIPLSIVTCKGKSFGEVRKLPIKLRNRLTAAIARLHKDGYSAFAYSENELVLQKDAELITCCLAHSSLLKDSFRELKNVLELLEWFLGARTEKTDVNSFCCSDCRIVKNPTGKCPNPQCLSHEKWAEVLDDYAPPGVTKKVPQKPDDINGWAQKC